MQDAVESVIDLRDFPQPAMNQPYYTVDQDGILYFADTPVRAVANAKQAHEH